MKEEEVICEYLKQLDKVDLIRFAVKRSKKVDKTLKANIKDVDGEEGKMRKFKDL